MHEEFSAAPKGNETVIVEVKLLTRYLTGRTEGKHTTFMYIALAIYIKPIYNYVKWDHIPRTEMYI
jgi:hypothetical protein